MDNGESTKRRPGMHAGQRPRALVLTSLMPEAIEGQERG